jgi:hypothetical protein
MMKEIPESFLWALRMIEYAARLDDAAEQVGLTAVTIIVKYIDD